jgi:hypothetical protein
MLMQLNILLPSATSKAHAIASLTSKAPSCKADRSTYIQRFDKSASSNIIHWFSGCAVQTVYNTKKVFAKQLCRTRRDAQDKLRAVRDRKDETSKYSTSIIMAYHNGLRLHLLSLSM